MWWYAIVFIAALVLVWNAMPKAQTAPPAGFNELQLPTAEEGRAIPVLFGTREIKSPNVVDYRNLRTVPVQSSNGK